MSVIARSPLELRGNPENNKRRTGLPHAAHRLEFFALNYKALIGTLIH
jgi:hypothetical protein